MSLTAQERRNVKRIIIAASCNRFGGAAGSLLLFWGMGSLTLRCRSWGRSATCQPFEERRFGLSGCICANIDQHRFFFNGRTGWLWRHKGPGGPWRCGCAPKISR